MEEKVTMSVIVYGMEMPEHCGYCRFRYDGICHALQKTQYSMEECPLVPVPEHGDLIDRDALLDTATIHWSQTTNESCFPIDEIEYAPTIIEADKMV